MKAEYDFSKGVRGKFYRPNARFQSPIYLDADVELFMRERATKKQMDVTALVNQLLRSDIALIRQVE